jgi:hypothetical protein
VARGVDDPGAGESLMPGWRTITAAETIPTGALLAIRANTSEMTTERIARVQSLHATSGFQGMPVRRQDDGAGSTVLFVIAGRPLVGVNILGFLTQQGGFSLLAVAVWTDLAGNVPAVGSFDGGPSLGAGLPSFSLPSLPSIGDISRGIGEGIGQGAAAAGGGLLEGLGIPKWLFVVGLVVLVLGVVVIIGSKAKKVIG